MREHKSYIALAPCGCLTIAAVDDPMAKRDVARHVARAIRRGDTIRLVDSAEVRAMDWLCAEHRAAREAKRAAGGKQEALL